MSVRFLTSLRLMLGFWLIWAVSAYCGEVDSPSSKNVLRDSKESMAVLDDIRNSANDKAEAPELRAKAVFILFSDFIRPGYTGLQVTSILGQTAWLDEADVRLLEVLGGGMPVNYHPGGRVFVVKLFSAANVEPPWVICFVLTGGGSGRMWTSKDGESFLRGNGEVRNCVLEEYALCFPDGIVERIHDGGTEITTNKVWHLLFEQKKVECVDKQRVHTSNMLRNP